MPSEDLILPLLLLLIVVLFGARLGQWLNERRGRNQLASREPLSAEDFSRGAFPGSPRKAEAARRVRSVLERYKKVPMNGLRATDRLGDDLRLDLAVEPDLFFALEEEFGFTSEVHDLAKFSALVERLRTVADLVEYVDRQEWSQ